VKCEFRNVLAAEHQAALEWTTEGAANGDAVSYEGMSILEVEGGKVCRFMAYSDTRDLTPKSWTDGATVAAHLTGLRIGVLRSFCLVLIHPLAEMVGGLGSLCGGSQIASGHSHPTGLLVGHAGLDLATAKYGAVHEVAGSRVARRWHVFLNYKD
jgi:hypothetical protein